MWRLPIPEFKVLAYGPDLPSSGLRAQAHFEPGVLVVKGKGHWYTIPANQLTLTTGGYDGRQWLIEWRSPSGPMTAMLQGEDTVEVFIRVAPPEVSAALRRAHQVQARGNRRFRMAGVALALALSIPLLLFTLYWVFAEDLSRWAAAQISVEQEIDLGEQAFSQLRRGWKLMEQGAAKEAVEQVGSRMTAPGGRYPYQFHVVQDPRINVWALPGGHVAASTGLLLAMESADELAGVLAHEISHIEHRHGLRHVIRGLGWRAVLGVARQDYSGSVWSELDSEWGRMRYSLDQERQADRDVIARLRQVGLSAKPMADFYARLGTGRGGYGWPMLFVAHPYGEERASALGELVGDATDALGQPVDIDWRNVKHCVGAPTGGV